MDSSATAQEQWLERVAFIEAMLERSGRENIRVVALRPLRRLVASTSLDQFEQILPLLGKALAEVRKCVMNPTLAPSAALFDAVEELAEQVQHHAAAAQGAGWELEAPQADGGAWMAAAEALDCLIAEGDLLAMLDHCVGVVAREHGRGGLPTPRVHNDTALAPRPATNLAASGPARLAATTTERLNESMQTIPMCSMAGDYHRALLPRLLAICAHTSVLGQLTIDSPRSLVRLFFTDGIIVDADSNDRHGRDPFACLPRVRSGYFLYRRGGHGRPVRFAYTPDGLLERLAMGDRPSA